MSINYKFDERFYRDDLFRIGRKGHRFVLNTSLKEYNYDKHAFIAEWPQNVTSFFNNLDAYFDENKSQSYFLSELSRKTDIVIASSEIPISLREEKCVKIRIYIREFNIAGECWVMEKPLSSRLLNLRIQDRMNDMLEYMSKENDTCVFDDLDEDYDLSQKYELIEKIKEKYGTTKKDDIGYFISVHDDFNFLALNIKKYDKSRNAFPVILYYKDDHMNKTSAGRQLLFFFSEAEAQKVCDQLNNKRKNWDAHVHKEENLQFFGAINLPAYFNELNQKINVWVRSDTFEITVDPETLELMLDDINDISSLDDLDESIKWMRYYYE